MSRVKEALETIDWGASSSGLDHILDDDDDNDGGEMEEDEERERKDKSIEIEVEELERELFGMGQPILSADDVARHERDDAGNAGDEEGEGSDGDQEQQIQGLERMMSKLQALRGTFIPIVHNIRAYESISPLKHLNKEPSFQS